MPLKRVVTISADRLPVVSADLLSLMRRGGFEPDLIVGIASGGARVVEAMKLPGELPSVSCRLRRATTELKERSRGRSALPRLPYAVLDVLRLLEDWASARRSISRVEATDVLRREVAEIGEFVREVGVRRVAVVDDALDSGATLECVIRTLREVLPLDIEVRSAVVTQTRPPHARLMTADFRLYDLVLLRFPWSFDYKGYA